MSLPTLPTETRLSWGYTEAQMQAHYEKGRAAALEEAEKERDDANERAFMSTESHAMTIQRAMKAEADAARYQFMKSRSRVLGLNINGNHSWTCQITGLGVVGPSLDEAIDAAIQARI